MKRTQKADLTESEVCQPDDIITSLPSSSDSLTSLTEAVGAGSGSDEGKDDAVVGADAGPARAVTKQESSQKPDESSASPPRETDKQSVISGGAGAAL